MKKPTLIVALFCVLTVGCRAKQPAVVHVYRNGTSPVAGRWTRGSSNSTVTNVGCHLANEL
jgi:hypothetical protein